MKPVTEAARFALATAIATNADARACAERLAGKAIAVECQGLRLVIQFAGGGAADAVRVRSGEEQADVTVRGSPAAVLGALAGIDRDTAAVFGDVEVYEDFRTSFRPHLKLPHGFDHLAEDASDAVHIAARVAQSACEGLLAALRERFAAHTAHTPPRSPATTDEDREKAELQARIRDLEARLAELEGVETSTTDESPSPAPSEPQAP